jgi:hypothetical protein
MPSEFPRTGYIGSPISENSLLLMVCSKHGYDKVQVKGQEQEVEAAIQI